MKKDETYDEIVTKAQAAVALEAGALFFQEEMLSQEEMIDLDLLMVKIMALIDDGENYLSWKELYPILKKSVV